MWVLPFLVAMLGFWFDQAVLNDFALSQQLKLHLKLYLPVWYGNSDCAQSLGQIGTDMYKITSKLIKVSGCLSLFRKFSYSNMNQTLNCHKEQLIRFLIKKSRA